MGGWKPKGEERGGPWGLWFRVIQVHKDANDVDEGAERVEKG